MPASSSEPACDGADHERMLRLAGAGPQSAVCVAGRGAVDLLVKLCRDGFARVECLRQATCACADGSADVLVIPGGLATESLVSVLLRTARVLRDGGVLVLRLDEIDDDCAVQAALAGLNWRADSAVYDLSAGVLVAHRVRRAEALALAG